MVVSFVNGNALAKILRSQERLNGKGHGRSAEEVSSGESKSALRKRGLGSNWWAPWSAMESLVAMGEI